MVSKYNAKDCNVIVGNVYLTQFGEDMVSIEKEEAIAENSVGAQGDVVRSAINNPIYNITVTLQQTSPQLPYLMQLSKSEEFVPIWVVNKALGLRAGGTKGGVLEIPEYALGQTAQDVEVTLCVYDGDMNFEQ